MLSLGPLALMAVFCLPVGYALLGSGDFGLWLPLYLGSGVAAQALVLLLVGWYHVSVLVPVVVAGGSLLIILSRRVSPTRVSLTSIALTLFSFYHFMNAAFVMRWPPIGDAISHGAYTAMIEYLDKVFVTYAPYAPEMPAYYPLGFHALSATFFPEALGVRPGESVLLMAAFFVALLPPLMYTCTHFLTGARVPSVLAFLSVWAVDTRWRLFITGNFYLGVYPFLAGLALSLTYVCLVVAEGRGLLSPQRLLLSGVVLSGAIFFVYPSFIFFTGGSLGYYLFTHRDLWRSWALGVSVAILGLIFLTKMPVLLLFRQVQTFTVDAMQLNFVVGNRVLVREFLMNSPNGWAILAAATAVALIYTSIPRHMVILYMCLFLSVIGAYFQPLFEALLWPTLPNRTVFLLSLLSWVIVAAAVHDAGKWFSAKVNGAVTLTVSGLRDIPVSKAQAAGAIILLLGYGIPLAALYPGLQIQLVDNAYPRNKLEAWYVTPPGPWGMLAWVHDNIPASELIMTSTAWSSLWLSSYGVHNTTNDYLSAHHDLNRAMAVNRVWELPDSEHYLKWVIEKYDIHYIMVTSDNAFFDWFVLNGTQNIGMSRPHTPAEYINVFDGYQFLLQIYREADNAVYEVVG